MTLFNFLEFKITVPSYQSDAWRVEKKKKLLENFWDFGDFYHSFFLNEARDKKAPVEDSWIDVSRPEFLLNEKDNENFTEFIYGNLIRHVIVLYLKRAGIICETFKFLSSNIKIETVHLPLLEIEYIKIKFDDQICKIEGDFFMIDDVKLKLNDDWSKSEWRKRHHPPVLKNSSNTSIIFFLEWVKVTVNELVGFIRNRKKWIEKGQWIKSFEEKLFSETSIGKLILEGEKIKKQLLIYISEDPSMLILHYLPTPQPQISV